LVPDAAVFLRHCKLLESFRRKNARPDKRLSADLKVFHLLLFHFNKEASAMVYVIAEPCIGTKDTACVDVCPVDCIHPKKDEPNFDQVEQLYIEPDECIDCGACVPACPVSAIFALEDLPEKWANFTQINADWYKTNKST
jgi:NAD-dependent dihydropyrimidine dehydrogenase PreA subunit